MPKLSRNRGAFNGTSFNIMAEPQANKAEKKGAIGLIHLIQSVTLSEPQFSH